MNEDMVGMAKAFILQRKMTVAGTIALIILFLSPDAVTLIFLIGALIAVQLLIEDSHDQEVASLKIENEYLSDDHERLLLKHQKLKEEIRLEQSTRAGERLEKHGGGITPPGDQLLERTPDNDVDVRKSITASYSRDLIRGALEDNLGPDDARVAEEPPADPLLERALSSAKADDEPDQEDDGWPSITEGSTVDEDDSDHEYGYDNYSLDDGYTYGEEYDDHLDGDSYGEADEPTSILNQMGTAEADPEKTPKE
jgi:hypothetical protein